MENLHLKADIGFPNGKYNIGLSLIEFKEDNVFIVYSPALDLSGYGETQNEAHKSFIEALQEFFKYTNNKNTLGKVLNQLGWSVKGGKKHPKFNPPKDSDLIGINPVYSDIINTKSYSVTRENLEFA